MARKDSYIVEPHSSKFERRVQLVRELLDFMRPESGFFETDFSWDVDESFGIDVATAVRRLCGVSRPYTSSGWREFQGERNQEWKDFLELAPFAFDASLFDKEVQPLVSLADSSTSIVVWLDDRQLQWLSQLNKSVAVFRRSKR